MSSYWTLRYDVNIRQTASFRREIDINTCNENIPDCGSNNTAAASTYVASDGMWMTTTTTSIDTPR